MFKTNTNDITEKRLEYYKAANLLIPNKYLILVNKRQQCEIFNVFQVNYHINFCFCSKNNPNIDRRRAKGKKCWSISSKSHYIIIYLNLLCQVFIFFLLFNFEFKMYRLTWRKNSINNKWKRKKNKMYGKTSLISSLRLISFTLSIKDGNVSMKY